MTDLLLPKHVAKARRAEVAASTAEAIKKSAVHRMDSDDFVTKENVADQLNQLAEYVSARRVEDSGYHLPTPAGWRVMVLMLTIPDESSGGVIIVDDTKEARSLSSPQGVVLDVGPSAYSDPERFEIDGKIVPWCGVGDRITFAKYDASMFQLSNGQRLGILNDTQPASVIDSNWEVPV